MPTCSSTLAGAFGSHSATVDTPVGTGAGPVRLGDHRDSASLFSGLELGSGRLWPGFRTFDCRRPSLSSGKSRPLAETQVRARFAFKALFRRPSRV